ncbi:MAG TPA: porin [Thermodesulfobacteriota bacterium]|nr:porin [Thermodesulfobacteriota bacterium]
MKLLKLLLITFICTAQAGDDYNISHKSKGLTFESIDGKWSTSLAWRAQLRYTDGYIGDPRQLTDFENPNRNTFEARRLRMKIGGHGYEPWLKYYFEVDLEPTRDVNDESEKSSGRVIDWRIDVAKYKPIQLRVGQWKIEYTRERVDSSGKQEFVERSIVNRQFTIDRQVGAQIKGRLFPGTYADMRYWVGMYTGEGRGVRNDDDGMLYSGRLQWNFLGRDLPFKQTDVERTEKPTASLAFAVATNKGRCTRWSSSGCGGLSAYDKPQDAILKQYKIDQMAQEFAFKWQGLSIQEEYHWKNIKDRLSNTENNMTGMYVQTGYFPGEIISFVPDPFQVAFRYAFVKEANKYDRSLDNNRREYTAAINWFIAGHNNKITADYSRLTLDENFFNRNVSDDRFRVQWDITF